MLSFDLRSLDSEAVHVDAVLAADDAIWNADDARPRDGVHVTGRLSTAGAGRYYFSGRIDGVSQDACRRCLVDASAPVTEDVQLVFAGSDGEESDESDVYLIDTREYNLDLRPAIREQWLLAVPSLLVCRDECKGLCPTCGADLNDGACSCAPTRDPRWDALRSMDESAR
ncbi:MAG: DUF177 domain-containing protein [Gemmatimonadaceae bacterium]